MDDPVAEADTMWGLLERRVELSPDRVMLIDEHDRTLTFEQFRQWAERVAAGLTARGVSNGTPVSWQLPTRLETVVLSMALSRLGAVQNPIIALYREREVGSLLQTAGTKLFAVPGVWRGFDYADMAQRLLAVVDEPYEILNMDDGLPEGDPATLPPAPTDGDTVRWLYSTSGTTSYPKAVCHTDQSLIAGGIGIAEAMRPTRHDITCIPFPYAHIGGPDNLVMQLRRGFAVMLIEVFSPKESFAHMRRHGVTIIGGSTAHYLAALAEQARVPDVPVLPTLRIMSGGGAPKPPELYWQLKEKVGAVILHGYGMTECPMIADGSVDDTDEQLANTDGRPVRDCEIVVVDDNGEAVASGVDGDILVRGPMLAKGYTDPDLTKESFLPNGFFRTGDRGHLRSDGHIVLTGRTKELIIRKGENISPREIEDVLQTHPKVGAVAVIGLPDAERGERICAVVEPAVGAEPLTFAEMQQACREAGLMIQKTPEQLETVDALPRNPTMKILKRDLVERFAHQP
ncbi:MAG: putative acyl-CoA synthetase [Acidimicrobiia bacterium]|nr:putative acyl-CoA synthetase [Acidimicrobiia bacterium]